ncbi:MAG: holo-ACP synthase [Pedobacter sp.]|nr:MAG: holo-ACP synthase [Pedobacter sp.]
MGLKTFNDTLQANLADLVRPVESHLWVGNDLVYLPDFEKSLNPLFIKKVYTHQEIAYCEAFQDKNLHYASTWAAKEAVYKALKQFSIQAWGFKKIEILRAKVGGKPSVNIGNHLAAKHSISLTISHDGDYVWAIALLEKHDY